LQSPKICSCFCFPYDSILMVHSMSIRCNYYICMEQFCSYVASINQETFLCISWLLVTNNYFWIWIEYLTVYWSMNEYIKIMDCVYQFGSCASFLVYVHEVLIHFKIWIDSIIIKAGKLRINLEKSQES